MPAASTPAPFARLEKLHRPAVRRWGRTALRWIAGISILALLAVIGFGVGAAFAHLAREEALIGAYQEAVSDAARAAGGNPGSDWESLLETPAGRRRLALWFDTMRGRWPSACAARMAQVNQSSVACLPDSGFLQALLEARLEPKSFAALAENAAADALERAAAPSLDQAGGARPGRETTNSDIIVQDGADAVRWASPSLNPMAFAADQPPVLPPIDDRPPDTDTPPIETIDGIVAPPPAQALGTASEPAPAPLQQPPGTRSGSNPSLFELSTTDPPALGGTPISNNPDLTAPSEVQPTTGRW
ncbi:MAG: hypothetical protein KGS44_15230 [Alphaproteobacteria bacterium]|nr:hypothetical protein [Alphaproteobacteria bacterium]